MRQQSPPPRLAREGWVPAGPDKRVNKCAMLIPKTGHPSDHPSTTLHRHRPSYPASRARRSSARRLASSGQGPAESRAKAPKRDVS